jgi:hypothetical protein
LHFLRFPIEPDLIGVEDHLLSLDLDVALAFDFVSLFRYHHGVRAEIDLLRRLCRPGPGRLSKQRPGPDQTEGENQTEKGVCLSGAHGFGFKSDCAQAKSDRSPLYTGAGD